MGIHSLSQSIRQIYEDHTVLPRQAGHKTKTLVDPSANKFCTGDKETKGAVGTES